MSSFGEEELGLSLPALGSSSASFYNHHALYSLPPLAPACPSPAQVPSSSLSALYSPMLPSSSSWMAASSPAQTNLPSSTMRASSMFPSYPSLVPALTSYAPVTTIPPIDSSVSVTGRGVASSNLHIGIAQPLLANTPDFLSAPGPRDSTMVPHDIAQQAPQNSWVSQSTIPLIQARTLSPHSARLLPSSPPDLSKLTTEELQASLDALAYAGRSNGMVPSASSSHVFDSMQFGCGESSSNAPTSRASDLLSLTERSQNLQTPASTAQSVEHLQSSSLSTTSSSRSKISVDSDRASSSSSRAPVERSAPRKDSQKAEPADESDDLELDDVSLINFRSRSRSRVPRKARYPRSAPAQSRRERERSPSSDPPKDDAGLSALSRSQGPSKLFCGCLFRKRPPFAPPAPGSMPKRPKKRDRRGRIIIYTPKNGGKARRYPKDHAPARRWDALESTVFWLFFFPCRTSIGWNRNWSVIGHLLRRTREQAKSHGQKMFMKWAKHPVLRDFIPPTVHERRSALPKPYLFPTACIFGRQSEGKFSMESEPLIPANHASMNEDTLEARALWWANGIELPKIERVNAPARMAPVPRAQSSSASRSSSPATSSKSSSSLSSPAKTTSPKKRPGGAANQGLQSKKRKAAALGDANASAAKKHRSPTNSSAEPPRESPTPSRKKRGRAKDAESTAASSPPKKLSGAADSLNERAAKKRRTTNDNVAAFSPDASTSSPTSHGLSQSVQGWLTPENSGTPAQAVGTMSSSSTSQKIYRRLSRSKHHLLAYLASPLHNG